MMRVTQSMLAANSLRNISNSYSRMGKLQDQLSTGKKITKPSDDPVVAVKGMFYRSQLNEVDQYTRNLSELHMWMDNSEAGMGQVNSDLQRVRELVVQGQDGSLSPDDRKAIAVEVDQIKQDIVNTANTKVAGKYIFHGNNVADAPVTDGSPAQVAADIKDKTVQNYSVEVSSGVSLRANIDPNKVFNQDLFNALDEIKKNLENNKPLDDSLSNLDNVMNNVSAERSDLGARSNRLDMVETRLNQQNVLANKVLSDNEDAEIEKVIVDLTTQESVHRAALSVGSQIIQPTLMDFLR